MEMVNVNKGFGAGGKNTNHYGKIFETKTNNYDRLINNGYQQISLCKNPKKQTDYYLTKKVDDKTITFVLQTGLKKYMNMKYNIPIFRYPDEAFIIEYDDGKIVIKIIEKKEQHVDGSVETKLWSSPSLKREYELVLGERFNVEYCLCISEYLQRKITSGELKYVTLNHILYENGIKVLFGCDENYFQMFDEWFNNSL
jgi:hypothetical protein